jgi:hypothetical protein
MLCVHLASIFVRSEDGTIPDRLREHIISDGRRPAGRLRLGCPGVGVRVGEGPGGQGEGSEAQGRDVVAGAALRHRGTASVGGGIAAT